MMRALACPAIRKTGAASAVKTRHEKRGAASAPGTSGTRSNDLLWLDTSYSPDSSPSADGSLAGDVDEVRERDRDLAGVASEASGAVVSASAVSAVDSVASDALDALA